MERCTGMKGTQAAVAVENIDMDMNKETASMTIVSGTSTDITTTITAMNPPFTKLTNMQSLRCKSMNQKNGQSLSNIGGSGLLEW